MFNCSHMWLINCSLVPKIIRMVLKAYNPVHERSLADKLIRGRLNQFHALTRLKGPQEGTNLYKTQNVFSPL